MFFNLYINKIMKVFFSFYIIYCTCIEQILIHVNIRAVMKIKMWQYLQVNSSALYLYLHSLFELQVHESFDSSPKHVSLI